MVQFNSLEMSVYISLIIHKKHDILHGGGNARGYHGRFKWSKWVLSIRQKKRALSLMLAFYKA